MRECNCALDGVKDEGPDVYGIMTMTMIGVLPALIYKCTSLASAMALTV